MYTFVYVVIAIVVSIMFKKFKKRYIYIYIYVFMLLGVRAYVFYRLLPLPRGLTWQEQARRLGSSKVCNEGALSSHRRIA